MTSDFLGNGTIGDTSGSVLISQIALNSPTGITVTTEVGGLTTSSCPRANGAALSAGLKPNGMAIDYAGCGGAGCLYWIDVQDWPAIRMLDRSTGLVSTITGSATGCPAGAYVDGPAASACFVQPVSLAFVPATGKAWFSLTL